MQLLLCAHKNKRWNVCQLNVAAFTRTHDLRLSNSLNIYDFSEIKNQTANTQVATLSECGETETTRCQCGVLIRFVLRQHVHTAKKTMNRKVWIWIQSVTYNKANEIKRKGKKLEFLLGWPAIIEFTWAAKEIKRTRKQTNQMKWNDIGRSGLFAQMALFQTIDSEWAMFV